MAFSNDPSRDIDRIRMTVGDIDPQNEFLSDDWYRHFLSQNDNNEKRTTLAVARQLLAVFAGSVRHRVDQVEIYGDQKFDQYLKWLKEFTDNPNSNGFHNAMPYAGGISRSDILASRESCDEVGTRIYLGHNTDYCSGINKVQDRDSIYSTSCNYWTNFWHSH